MTPRSTLRVRVIAQRSRSQGQKTLFPPSCSGLLCITICLSVCYQTKHQTGYLFILTTITWVKGHLGQRSRGSWSILGSFYWQVGSLQRQVAFLIFDAPTTCDGCKNIRFGIVFFIGQMFYMRSHSDFTGAYLFGACHQTSHMEFSRDLWHWEECPKSNSLTRTSGELYSGLISS